ncbi:solute carrier family 22 member 3-like isoform X2 [Rhodnius prolixus]|uniref:solute carrier family 22 member 3-like isoform X2 n=1 Tax=Rhodnius prolixus TaxID=13249 RepID=UPI003D189482
MAVSGVGGHPPYTISALLNGSNCQERQGQPSKLGGLEYNPCNIKKLNFSLSYEEMMKSRSADEITCTGWEYSQEWWTIIAQFNLACSKLPINTLAESVFSAGAACSCLIVGIAADRHGRRSVLLVAQFVQMVTGIITGLSSSYTGYLVSTGIQGFVCNALMTCTSVLCVEVTGGRWKSTMSVFYMYSYGLGYFTLAGLAYFFRRWNHLHIVISLLSLLLFSFWWFLPESPRWLLTRNQLDGVMGVLEAAASINSKPLPSDVVVRIKKMEVLYFSGQRNKVEVEMLFKTPIMKHLTVITPFIFFFIFISYYGLTLRKVTLFSITDIMHVLMIKGGLEMIATSVALILTYCPGIMFLVVSTLVEGILCLASTLWPSRSPASMVLILASRFFASVTNTSIAMTVASFYPTSIRMTGLGWGYTCVGLALFVATNVVNLGRISENLPQVLFGTSACLGSVLLLLLPKQLEESCDLISQLENTEIKRDDIDISEMLRHVTTKRTLIRAESTRISSDRKSLKTTTSKSKVPFLRF